jgi:SAM-dependent methyltransferase
MLSFVGRLAKRLNWSRRRWSTDRDRAFHDSLFAAQTYDPFSASYPGYLTIRRFADLAEPHIRAGGLVCDLGCGPGEVTCELARRLPAVRFVGADHSAEAIGRAKKLAAGLGLTNIRFELEDLERYQPPARVDLVLMFDAFHHLLAPAAFIERVGKAADRFFLIEPAGNRVGQWQKTLDLDWLAEALLVVRDRVEYQFDVAASSRQGSAPAKSNGEPTEHRYSMEDFVRLFEGFGLEVHGTIAGLERYGTAPYATSPLRDDIGRNIYSLMVDLEMTLRRANLDLAAKHWAIYAERGRTVPARIVGNLSRRDVTQPLTGPYDAEYDKYHGPTEAAAGTEVRATVQLFNQSWRVWDSLAADGAVLVSYHWLDAAGRVVVEDGLRSPLPRPLAPGERLTTAFRFQCPTTPGRYTLAVDLVHERVTWFSQAGVPPLEVRFRVVE